MKMGHFKDIFRKEWQRVLFMHRVNKLKKLPEPCTESGCKRKVSKIIDIWFRGSKSVHGPYCKKHMRMAVRYARTFEDTMQPILVEKMVKGKTPFSYMSIWIKSYQV